MRCRNTAVDTGCDGVAAACPAWEVQNWQFADLPKSQKCLIRRNVDYPALPADIRRSPWRGARLGARSRCPAFLAGLVEPS